MKDFTFRGEETSFTLILFNLIKNALYYLPTHPSTTVTVTIDSGSTNRVVVRDTGPGIPPEPNGPPVHRVPDSRQIRRHRPGPGVLPARHAGLRRRHHCRSRLGEFTEFTLTFPAVPEGELQAHQEAILQRTRVLLAGKRILVVDDERPDAPVHPRQAIRDGLSHG